MGEKEENIVKVLYDDIRSWLILHVINEDWWSMTQNIDLSEKVPTVNLLTDKFGKSGGSYTNLDGDKNSNSSS